MCNERAGLRQLWDYLVLWGRQRGIAPAPIRWHAPGSTPVLQTMPMLTTYQGVHRVVAGMITTSKAMPSSLCPKPVVLMGSTGSGGAGGRGAC
jgi:hypothetical protein